MVRVQSYIRLVRVLCSGLSITSAAIPPPCPPSAQQFTRKFQQERSPLSARRQLTPLVEGGLRGAPARSRILSMEGGSRLNLRRGYLRGHSSLSPRVPSSRATTSHGPRSQRVERNGTRPRIQKGGPTQSRMPIPAYEFRKALILSLDACSSHEEYIAIRDQLSSSVSKMTF